ncbi:MAG TPA: HAD family acid phosphatase [Lacunisphaera sp.]|jgi:acid phosphatase|nr:HAD family acid phosphatase [Lacunisphaera sp.]
MTFRPWLLPLALTCLAPALLAKEPANLAFLKDEINAYVASGEYNADIAGVAHQAAAWLDTRAPQGGGKLAIVFDLDETLLSNWPELSQLNFGGERKAMGEWFETASCPAIEPVRELYRHARQLGVQVIYITGRPERYRAATQRNLEAVGCGDYAEFILKPAEWKETAEKFKTAERQRLTAAGYVIIANIGDQQSDLAGGFAEKTFKLPNPFYFSK